MEFILERKYNTSAIMKINFENAEELEKAWEEYQNGKGCYFPPKGKYSKWIQGAHEEVLSYYPADYSKEPVVLAEYF